MFDVSLYNIKHILKDYGINLPVSSFVELQRDNYENSNSDLKQVRLISKINFENNSAVVIRFRNETGVTLDLVEKQSQFAELLRVNGISCPIQYKAEGSFSKIYFISGYEVIVTVEDYVNGELKIVDEEIAEKTGKLLAQTHNISEKFDFHVEGNVLFDPFNENELFSIEGFLDAFKIVKKNNLSLNKKSMFNKIIDKYNSYMDILSPLKSEPRYAVQGDISSCNLYKNESVNLGIFDFNRCGDNNLYCDAVMQAVFESSLMDYPKGYAGKGEGIILLSFLKGYMSERPFSDLHYKLFPYLYAIIKAFWSEDIIWDNHSLLKECERKNLGEINRHLERIWHCLSNPPFDILET